MASVADKKRARKARTVARAHERTTIGVTTPAQVRARARARAVEDSGYVRRQTGLECLAARGKISARQRARGEAYGRLFRVAGISDGAAIQSALGDLDRVRGAGGAPIASDYSSVLVDARSNLLEAREALGFHTGLILACDLICGRTMTPQEITAVRREAEQIETSLRISLDLLDKHWGDAVTWWT